MVKKAFYIALSVLLSFSSALMAGSFSASVSSTEVHANEPFFLTLTLTDSSTKDAPAYAALNQQFLLHSQQKFAHTAINNGKVSSSMIWKLSLIPKTEGTVQIPPLAIQTKDGVLSTEPITLHVVKASASQAAKDSKDSMGLNLVNRVSNTSPYKNEPFVYTALLTSRLPLYNLQAQKLQVDDAIVELLGEPKLEEKQIGRNLMYVVEFHYLITPLKTGALNIPSITIQGAVPQKRKERLRSIFDDELESFAFMQGFDPLKPFTLVAETISLNVHPAIAEVSPWLPARSLTLTEQWPNEQFLRVGEPFSRGILIQAEGLKASQLPHLDELHHHAGIFKVYADSPKTQEKMSQGIIGSTRQEHYTLIPQQAGHWVLPEISIPWWDSVNKVKKTSTIPARTIEILPAAGMPLASHDNPSVSQDAAISSAPKTEVVAASTDVAMAAEESISATSPPPYVLYGIMGALAFFLTVALFWGIVLHRKITNLTQDAPNTRGKLQPIKHMPPATHSVVAIPNKSANDDKLPDLNPT